MRRVGPPLGDVHHRGRAGVQPVSAELERRAVADLEAEHVAVEVARALDVVGEHEHVLDPTDRHAGRGSAPATACSLPEPLRPRNRYADWSRSGFSRNSLAKPENSDRAALHDVGAVREPERERRELLDQQHAGAGLGDRPDRRYEPVDDDRREPERELVDDHEPRMGHERLREHDHLLLAARERAGRIVEALLELGEQLERALALGRRRPRSTACRWRRGDSRPRSARGAAGGPRGRSRARPGGSAPDACRRKSSSSSSTFPASGFSTPPIASTMLDLPAPLGPSSAVISPEGMSSETPRTTLRPPRATISSSIRRRSPDVVTRPPRFRDRRGSPARRGVPRRSGRTRSSSRSRAPRSPRSRTTQGSCRGRPGSPARPCAQGSR